MLDYPIAKRMRNISFKFSKGLSKFTNDEKLFGQPES